MKLKPLHWIASSKKDLMKFPEAVRDEAGFALYLAQAGNMALDAVPMVGFGGSKVVEVVIDNRGNTFRAVYTVKFARAVYVLHVFQKKAKQGVKTSQSDMNLIRERLRAAENHYRMKYSG
jgi:phage-related protein